MSTPAGWYKDPAGSARQRWWDGNTWTEHFSEPYSATAVAAALKAPEGTKVFNLWIWLVLFVPYLSLPLLFTVDFSSMFSGIDYSNPNASTTAQFEMMTSPSFLILSLSGWVLGALGVLFAFLDWRWLKAAGVPKPFHWAFAFFGLAGYPVYAIGRAVVTRRRTGQGIVVMWVAIGLIVLSFLVAIIWTASLVATMMSTLPFS